MYTGKEQRIESGLKIQSMDNNQHWVNEDKTGKGDRGQVRVDLFLRVMNTITLKFFIRNN